MMINRERCYRIMTVMVTGVSVGIAARFWRALFTPAPPFTLDWTPAVYWLIGLVWSMGTVRLVWAHRTVWPRKLQVALLILNGASLLSFLWVLVWIVITAPWGSRPR